MDWTQEEMTSLLQKVLEMVGNKHSFAALRSKIQWDKLGVSRDAKECEQMFNVLTAKIRKFRLFDEIIQEATSEISKGYSLKFCTQNYPDFPKKPSGPMHLLMQDRQHEYKDVPGKDILQVMVQKWKECPEETKNIYKKKQEKKMKKYLKKLEEFKKNHPAVVLRFSKASGQAQQARAPPLPTPTSLFMKHIQSKVQAKHKDLNSNQLRSKCVSKFHKLSDSKKLKWILQARELLPEYEAQYRIFKEKNPAAKIKSPSLLLTKEQQKILDRHEGKPVAPPANMFLYFSHQQEVDPGIGIAERQRQISQNYNKLSVQEQAELADKYHEVVQNYMDDFTTYYASLTPEKQQFHQKDFMALASYQRALRNTKPKKRKLPGENLNGPAKKIKQEISSADDSDEPLTKSPTKVKSSKTQSSNSAGGKDDNQVSSVKSQKPSQSDSSSSDDELDDRLLSFSTPSPTRKTKRVPSSKQQQQPAAETQPEKKEMASDGADDFDAVPEFSSPAASVKKGKRSPKKRKSSSPQKQEPEENEDPAGPVQTKVEEAMISMFSPIRTERSSRSAKRKSKGKA